ncbi:hypothetical protein R6Q59_005371 [Mikania micrantha]
MDSSCSNSNMNTTKESIMPKIIKKMNVEDDDEFGVFGAEKYFKGLTSASYDNGLHRHRNRSQEERLSDSKTMSSVRSDSSWNSRRGLLVSNFGKKTSLIKRWLDCNCNDKDSVKIKDAKQPVKGGDLGHKTKSFSSRWADHHKHVNSIREDPFMFPVVNTANITNAKSTKQPEFKQKLKGKKKKSFSFNEAAPKTENGREIDMGSDASSDLFEIESFLTNENNSFLDRQTIKNNRYTPSEASVDQSVVTLGVSDPSQDLKVATKQSAFSDKRVSRCTSLNALRVSGDEHGMIGVTDEIEGRGYGTVSGPETPKGESGATGWNEPHR